MNKFWTSAMEMYFCCNCVITGYYIAGLTKSKTVSDAVAKFFVIVGVLLFGSVLVFISVSAGLIVKIFKRTWIYYGLLTLKTYYRFVYKKHPVNLEARYLKQIIDNPKSFVYKMPWWLSCWWVTFLNKQIEIKKKENTS